MFDSLSEIFSVLKQNKLRAIMTGFSVAWGIFMLLILLGSGKGLENGMRFNFRGSATNSIWVNSGETTQSHEGYKEGRRIQFTNEDYTAIKNEISGISNLSGRVYLYDSAPLTYKDNFGVYQITCVMPAFFGIEKMDIIKGRFINDIDIKESRKVIVLSQPIVDTLFDGDEPLGAYIKVGGIPYKVVGVFRDVMQRDERKSFMPITTGQKVFGQGNRIQNFAITTASESLEENRAIEKEVRHLLARRHRFSQTDQGAIFIWNTLENFRQVLGVFTGIRIFIWIIGIMTIIAGIVGVSNIMIILVKERTKEIGIRKSIGASPWSVIKLVMSESLLITALSGFFGLLAGMGVLHFANMILQSIAAGNPDINSYFHNPSADFQVAVTATFVLVISGLIAGFIPAKKAAAIKPIEALHDE
ncbi:ABC transporter permease [Marinilabiliaceae bacterium ANBcel2]|nr:ABC transporter permease [Marinilabiliaceae bacterium ANBcel2]